MALSSQTTTQNPKKHKKSKKSKVKTALKWIFIPLGTLIFLVVIAFFVLMYTALGTKIAHKAIDHFVPELKIEKMDGSLHDLTIHSLHYQQEGLETTIQSAKLSFSPLSFFKRALVIHELNAQDVQVNVETAALESDEIAEKSDTEDQMITLPIQIVVENVALQNVSAQVDDAHYDLSQLSSRLNWQGSTLTIEQLQLNQFTAQLPEAIKEESNEPQEAQNAESAPINIQKSIDDLFAQPILQSAPPVFIPLNINIEQLQLSDIALTQNKLNPETHVSTQEVYQLHQLNLTAQLRDQALHIEDLNLQASAPQGSSDLSLTGKMTFTQDWPADLTLQLHAIESQHQNPIELNYALNGAIFAHSQHHLQLQGQNDLDLKADVDLSKPFLPLNVQLRSAHLQWPLFTQEAEYHIDQTALTLNGAVNDFNIDLQSTLKTPYKEASVLNYQLAGTGSDKGLSFQQLELDLPKGKMSGKVDLDWQQAFKWQTQLQFVEFDLSQLSEELTTKLNGNVATHGQIDLNQLDDWQIALEDLDLVGTIKKEPLRLQGALSATPQQIASNGLDLSWGKNKIQVRGDTQNDLKATVDLKALKLFHPELSGSVFGDLNLKGSLTQYQMKADFKVNQLQFDDLKINQLTLKNALNYQEDRYFGDFILNGRNLKMGELEIANANLEFKGTEAQHRLKMTVQSNLLKTQIELEGHLNADRSDWQGAIKTLNLDQNVAGFWRLNHPMKIDAHLDQQTATIDPFCLVNRDQSLCLMHKAQVGASGDVQLAINKVNLENYVSKLTNEYSVKGNLNGSAHMQWTPEMKMPTLHALFKSDPIVITELMSGQNKTARVQSVTAQADVNSDKALIDLNLMINQKESIKSEILVQDPMDKKSVSGVIAVDKVTFNFLELFLIDDEKINGYLDGALHLSGNLEAPKLNGELDLVVNQIKLSQIETNIKAVNTKLIFLGDHSKLQGVIQTKTGDVAISGSSSWATLETWQSEVNLKGGPLEVSVPEMVTLSLEPNLAIQASNDAINIKGKVVIPKALITIESLPPSIVEVSNDVVMLNENLVEIAPEQLPIPVNLAVFVVLGDNVKIDAYGLNANLTGNLLVEQTPKGMTGMGKITIPNGRYHAYGQDLIIRKGEIIFAGPLDNPNINIEAIRNPDSIENNVTAGIRITGFADQPEVEVFSEPAMSQQEALSYLFTGQGFDAEAQSQNDMMTALLIGVGASQSGQYLGEVGSMFGLKDLSIDTVGVGNDQRVVVSGYLNPRLQLKYSIGIFNAIAKYTARYRLMPKLYLEASSSIEQSVDLIYQFEL